MGNQLTGIAPSQIQPVEHYLIDATGQHFDSSLGNTRFFKVARTEGKEGFSVVKVFVIHDPSLPLNSHKEKLDEIRVRLQGASNCLPFQHAVQTDKSALLFRQYIKDSLYDRISTRPFFNTVEKKWIAFQLLCALNQCHKLKVCHGDIKMENCLVTSWNWLLLADFASFKPTFLPEDNPSDFNYFFDTSRRRTCYIAPERFLDITRNADSGGQIVNLTSSGVVVGDLTPSMDIFSAGCVIIELFTEGVHPFDFAQLLSYRNGDYSPWKILEMIDDVHIRELCSHMIQRNPAHRLSAEEYLIQQREKAFPDCFYTFLKPYLQRFSTQPIAPSDEKISRISHDFAQIQSRLRLTQDSQSSNLTLTIVLSFVIANCRSLRYCSSKLVALELLSEFSNYLPSDVILDRIIPYMLYFVNDTFPRVRAQTLTHTTRCLANIAVVPQSDANIFPEYILPNLAHLTHDPETMVRVAYAENIAKLAETAVRVIEMMQIKELMDGRTEKPEGLLHYQTNYDREILLLQEMIQQKVVTLLSDPDNIVKQVLASKGLTQLCVFFGRLKANDILLSHLVTFLNDKHDWHLRACFFDNIIGIATYIGWQSTVILKPLFQQGLSDPEEFVIYKALLALTSLTEISLIKKSLLYDFVTEAASLLAHPNTWIRQAVVGFISAVSKVLNVADIHCRLLPLVDCYLEHPIIQLDKPVIILNSLKEPIPKAVFDYIMRSSHLEDIYATLERRAVVQSSVTCWDPSLYNFSSDQMAQIFRKLTSQGMKIDHEEKLLKLKDFILKKHQSQISSVSDQYGADADDEARSAGEIDVKRLHQSVTRRHAELDQNKGNNTVNRKKKKELTIDPTPAAMNSEWKSMFGSDIALSPATRAKNKQEIIDRRANTINSASSNELLSIDIDIKKRPVFDKQTTITRYASCKLDLQNLVYRRRAQYVSDALSQDLLEGVIADHHLAPSNWKPQGHLVAHMHEHRAAINRIAVSQDRRFFSTCSNDGTVKLWDASLLDGKSVANRSRYTYNKQGGKINNVIFIENSTSLASTSLNDTIYLMKLETGESCKLTTSQVKAIDASQCGQIVDINNYDSGSHAVLVYVTVYGHIIGWDNRSPDVAWNLKNNCKHGLITSLAVEQGQSWMAVGTSTGAHVCWDMRFHLPITTITHPTGARVRKLTLHPTEPSWLLSAVQGNNEISMWDVETGTRQKTLWASGVSALSQSQVSSHSVHGFHIETTDSKTFILTGGSDMRIRCWDLTNPKSSSIMVSAAGDNNSTSVAYRMQVMDGTEVLQETYSKAAAPNTEDVMSKISDSPSTGHRDVISDVKLCRASQCLVVSASRDGVVKLWK